MTEKQKIFADEYLIDLNATRAYKVAYPKVKKDKTAAQAGSRMLRNVKVENIMRGSQIAIPLPLIGSKKGCTKNVTPLEAVRSAQGSRPVRHPCMI